MWFNSFGRAKQTWSLPPVQSLPRLRESRLGVTDGLLSSGRLPCSIPVSIDPMTSSPTTSYDVVFLSTGLVESIVAAALAVSGKRVLQIDRNDQYGSSWSTVVRGDRDGEEGGRGDEGIDSAGWWGSSEANVPSVTTTAEAEWWGSSEANVPSVTTTAEAKAASATLAASASALLARQPRRPELVYLASSRPPSVRIDLNPRLAYADGPLVSLLLASGAHNYAEFVFCKTVVWSLEGRGEGGGEADEGAVSREGEKQRGSFVGVAASKGDVFKDRSLSLAQKNSLMRALKELAECPARPWRQVSDEMGLDAGLVDRFVHGVCLSNGVDEVDAIAGGLLATYGRSLGKYVAEGGRTSSPFLYPKYGCGELCSAFARRAAVAGAVQMLRCAVVGIERGERAQHDDDSRSEGRFGHARVSERQPLGCEHQQRGVDTTATDTTSSSPPATTVHLLVRDDEGVERRVSAPVVVGRGRRRGERAPLTARCCALVRGQAIPHHPKCLAAFPRASSGGGVVWMLQLDRSSGCCDLEGHTIVQLWTTAATATAQGAVHALEEFREILERDFGWQMGSGGSGGGEPVAIERTASAPRIEALWAWYDDGCNGEEETCTADADVTPSIVTDYDGDLTEDGLVSFASLGTEAERLFRLVVTRTGDEVAFPFAGDGRTLDDDGFGDGDGLDDELELLEGLLRGEE